MTVSMIGEPLLSNRFDTRPLDRPDATERTIVGPRELYRLVRRHLLVIAGIVCLGTLASMLAAYWLPKTYTARSMLLLETDDPNLLEDQPEAVAKQPSHQTMDTESDLIKSRSFAGRVVDKLSLVAEPAFNPSLREGADTRPSGTAAFFGLPGPFGSMFATASDETTAAPMPHAEVQRDQAISILLSKLATVRNGESMALAVSISHDDAALAAKLANTVTGQFVEWSREIHRDDIRNAAVFLREQAQELAASIAAKEREISDYSSRLNVSSDPRDDLLRLAMQQTNEQLSTARGIFTQAQARLAQVEHGGGGTVGGTDPLLKSDFLTTLRNEEAVASRDRAQLARNHGANHPLMQEVDARIADLRQAISKEMAGIVVNLRNDVGVARESIAKLEAELVDLNKALRRRSIDEIRLRELNRDLLTEQKLYDLISARLGKIDPFSDSADPGARVISFAEVPTEPSFPKPRMMVAGGLTGSLVLAFIVALTLESLDSRIYSAKRLSALLQAPVFAAIPRIRPGVLHRSVDIPAYLSAHPRSRIGEAFHSLRNACRRSRADPRAQVVMVSSPSPSEGRTTVAIGLACMAALQGERTVLVDLDGWSDDMRRQLDIDEGLQAVEDEMDGRCGLADALQGVSHIPHLDVAISRGRRGKCAGVLQAHALEAFIGALREEYDLVVVDAPPLLAVEDAATIAAIVDGVILVAACGRTTEEAIGEARERIRLNDARLIGGVLNGADRKASASGFRPSRVTRRKIGRYFTD